MARGGALSWISGRPWVSWACWGGLRPLLQHSTPPAGSLACLLSDVDVGCDETRAMASLQPWSISLPRYVPTLRRTRQSRIDLCRAIDAILSSSTAHTPL